MDAGSGQVCTDFQCQPLVVTGCGHGKPKKMALKESLYAFPNPVAAGGAVTLTLPEGGAKLTLIDLNGRVIVEQSVSVGGDHRLLIPADLPAGIYLLRDEESRFEPHRILVQ